MDLHAEHNGFSGLGGVSQRIPQSEDVRTTDSEGSGPGDQAVRSARVVRDEFRLSGTDRAAMVIAAREMAEKTDCEGAIHSAACQAIGCSWLDLRDSELAYVDEVVVWALEYRRLGVSA